MTIADVVRRMAEAGAPAEAIAVAVEAIESLRAADEARRAAKRAGARERKQRQRSRVTSQPVTRDVTGTERDLPQDKEKSPPPPPSKENPTPSPSLRSGDAPARETPRTVLLECLSPEMADAVIEHRRAIRKPLTRLAAQLLASAFASTGSPEEAARMMVEKAWQGFKPEWFDNERAGHGRSNGRGKGNLVDAAEKQLRSIDDAIERQLRRADGDDPGGEVVRFLSGVGGQRS